MESHKIPWFQTTNQYFAEIQQKKCCKTQQNMGPLALESEANESKVGSPPKKSPTHGQDRGFRFSFYVYIGNYI